MRLVDLVARAEKKEIASFRLTPDQIEYLKNMPQGEASKLIRKSIGKEIQKEKGQKTLKSLIQISDAYGVCNYPKWNKLKECDGKTFYPTWLKPIPEGKNPAPQHYFEYVLCNEKPLSQEETDFLKSLDQLDVPLRQQLIRQALEKTMQKTEIKKGYPLLQFVVEHICPDLPNVESYLDTKPIKNKFSINELASKAGMSYDQFYRRVLPKLRVLLEWYGWSILDE